MIAVTIGVAEYATMAAYAAKAVRELTGLETVVIGDEHFQRSGLATPHHLKFRLFDLVDADQIMYFDADLVCLNAWDPGSVADPEAIVTVRDRNTATVRREAELANLRREEYFNSGLFFISRQHHRAWLRTAEESAGTISGSVFFDQTALNLARAQMGLQLRFLDRRYNWTGFGTGPLCYQIPAFMAHRLQPGANDVNIAYYEGRYQLPFHPLYTIDDDAIRRLAGKSISLGASCEANQQVRLRADGTLDPSPGPNGEEYWFMHSTPQGLRLSLTSETDVLRTFALPAGGAWERTDCMSEISITGDTHEPTPRPAKYHLKHMDTHDRVVILPFSGKFHWLIQQHVRYVHAHPARDKVVCCPRGMECLYPSAARFFFDYADPVGDDIRRGDGVSNGVLAADRLDDSLSERLQADFPGHHLVQPRYDCHWHMSDAIKFRPRTSRELPAADVALAADISGSLTADDRDFWPVLADRLRRSGVSIGIAGCQDTSLNFAADARSWDHSQGATAGTVDLLAHCGLFVGADSGVAHLAALMDVSSLVWHVPHDDSPNQIDILRRANRRSVRGLGENCGDPGAVFGEILRCLRELRG